MKKINANKPRIIVLTSVCILLAVVSMSFQNSFGPLVKIDALTEMNDTVPPGNGEAISRYEALISTMDKQILKMQEQIAGMNAEKIQHDINTALQLIETDKIRTQIKKAAKNIDYKKIENSINDALKAIDINHTTPAVKRSLQETKKELARIDIINLETEMERAITQIEKSKELIGKLNFDEIFKNAKTVILKAREDIQLEKDHQGTKEIQTKDTGS